MMSKAVPPARRRVLWMSQDHSRLLKIPNNFSREVSRPIATQCRRGPSASRPASSIRIRQHRRSIRMWSTPNHRHPIIRNQPPLTTLCQSRQPHTILVPLIIIRNLQQPFIMGLHHILIHQVRSILIPRLSFKAQISLTQLEDKLKIHNRMHRNRRCLSNQNVNLQNLE